MGEITKESIKNFLDYLSEDPDSSVRVTEGSMDGIHTVLFEGTALEQVILYEEYYRVKLAFITMKDKSVYTQHKYVFNQESLEKEILCWILETTEKAKNSKRLKTLYMM